MTHIEITPSLQASLAKWRNARPAERPRNYRKPPFGSMHYEQDFFRGWITDAEREADRLTHEKAQQDQDARRARAEASRFLPAAEPTRWAKPAPKQSRQYVNPMAVQGIRDARLSMGARALLVLIRARCGKGTFTEATKYAFALQLGRSTRTIQRYLCDLIRFGYITTKTRASAASGLYTGLRIWLSEKVTPFWAKGGELAEWMKSKGLTYIEAAQPLEFSDRTFLSPKNQIPKVYSLIGAG